MRPASAMRAHRGAARLVPSLSLRDLAGDGAAAKVEATAAGEAAAGGGDREAAAEGVANPDGSRTGCCQGCHHGVIGPGICKDC